MSLLEVDQVVVKFGGVTAVNEASFVAESGTITGLIGPNGAGKTTCFNVISGLQRPTSGKVSFDGKDVSRLPVNRRSKRGMGRTFQRLEAFGSLSVRDNVRVAYDIHRGLAGVLKPGKGDVDSILERVGIATYAQEPADAIPTGTARLLELARCLAGDPKILLLDEPSSGLDEDETDDFGDLLKELASEGKAILMVEHDMDLVMSVCDVIHVLDFGSIIASGEPGLIRSDPAVQKAYLGYSDVEDEAHHHGAAAEEYHGEDLHPTHAVEIGLLPAAGPTDAFADSPTQADIPVVAATDDHADHAGHVDPDGSVDDQRTAVIPVGAEKS